MKKWNMIIDVAECTNCNLCTLAAMDEYVGNDWPGYSAPMPKHGHKWINILQKERGQIPMIDIAYVPTMCNHCDDAPCIKAAPQGAIKKRKDGIVIIDPVKAKGQKQIVDACPYGHIWWNEEQQLPQAWTFDAHLIDQGWEQTRGQQSCPTGAMRAIKVEDEEMARMAREENLEVMKPELEREAAGLLSQPVALFQMLHRRLGRRDEERRRRLRRGRQRAAGQGRRFGRGDDHRQLRRLQIRSSSTRIPAAIRCRFSPAADPRPSKPASAPASISARSWCSRRRYPARNAALARLAGAFGHVSVAVDHLQVRQAPISEQRRPRRIAMLAPHLE